MSGNTKRPYSEVIHIANYVAETLRPYCDRIELAGSLRRNRPMIGDVEIVALPAYEVRAVDLFGSQLLTINKLARFLEGKGVSMIKNGTKYKRFKYKSFTVDLFLPESPAHWGCIYLIRTGSHDFNLWLMNVVQHRAGVQFDKGRLYRGGAALETPEEIDVFNALGLPWIAPNYRDDGKWFDLVGEGF